MAPSNHNAILPMFSPMMQQPEKKYRTIVADPPWKYELRQHDASHRARAPYPMMTTEEIIGLPVALWGHENSHLYLWTTNAHMLDAHRIAAAWGFNTKTILTWAKGRVEHSRLIQHMGTGNYYRGSTEHVLFCIRGSLPVLNQDKTTLFVAPRREHSEKPAAFYDMVEHMSPGPYLDVFARAQRFNWDTFGDESFNFGTTLPPAAFLQPTDTLEEHE